MKTESEIVRLHDQLEAIALGEVPNPFGPPGSEAELAAASCLQTLCWVLGHDAGAIVQENSDRATRYLADLGYVFQDHGCLLNPDDRENLR